MTTAILQWASRCRRPLATILMLVLFATLCGQVYAQEDSGFSPFEEVGAEPAEVETPAEEPAAAATTTEVSAPSFYANPLWLVVLILACAIWFYVTGWVSDDAKGIGLDHEMWSTVLLGAGAAGLVLTLLVYAALGVLMLVAALAAFGAYIAMRNKVVPEHHKFLGATHRARIFGRIPVLNQLIALAPTQRERASLPLTNEAGEALDTIIEQQPVLATSAEILMDIVARAGATATRTVRVHPTGEQYVVQFVMDEIPYSVEAFETEAGQKLLACVSQFIGMASEGRIRQGAAPLYAELPGMGTQEISVRVVASEGKPAVILKFPDWTADIYQKGLDGIGMHESIAKRVKAAVEQGSGMLLFCGPRGSGKTTTQYATLGAIDIFTSDVATLEKHEEHELTQMQRWELKPDRDFSEILHEILRQGPNVLMLGELETTEQANHMLEFATERGLVITGVESADAPNGVVKLAKMSGEPAAAASALTCAIGQRLVRRLCPNCRQEIDPNPELLAKLRIDPANPGVWFVPVGCDACLQSGYSGRTALFSMLIMSGPVKEALQRPDVSPAVVVKAAGADSFRSLYQDGVGKVTAGITTLDEVRRVLQGGRPTPPEARKGK
jgi:type II secretory ATPase GspE/PulE/Tfp pilus assembly ATPase PilB-like protein